MTLTFFSEDRLFLLPDGRTAASADKAVATGGWRRGIDPAMECRWAARVDSTVREDGVPVDGEVDPVRSYIGVAEFVRVLPRVVVDVWRSVRRTDAVAVRLPGALGLLAVACARLARRPVVVEVVGDIEDVLRADTMGRTLSAARPFARRVLQWAVRQGTVVRYVTRERLQARYPADPRATVVSFSDVDVPEEVGIVGSSGRSGAPRALRVAAVGSQEQLYKGHDDLIRAVAGLVQQGHDLQLVLIGSGRYQPHLRELAAELGLDQRVSFLGHVSREDVLATLATVDVFAMPSRTEGLPRALVEAMSLGVPCVGTAVGGIPELLDPEDLVPPDDPPALADAVARYLSDPDARIRAAERNRARVDRIRREAEAGLAQWRAAVATVHAEAVVA